MPATVPVTGSTDTDEDEEKRNKYGDVFRVKQRNES